jgi:Ca2+-transporting ATPase
LRNKIIDDYAKKEGLRTFVYAYKDVPEYEWRQFAEEHDYFKSEDSKFNVEKDLTFVIAFGIEDRLRPGVFDSIKNLGEAKINVRMISGDNLDTACRVAVNAGIIKENQISQEDVCMTGEKLFEHIGRPIKNNEGKWVYPDELKDVIQRKISHKCRVLARCTPE